MTLTKRIAALEARAAQQPAGIPAQFWRDLSRVYGDDDTQQAERLTPAQLETLIAEVYDDGHTY